MAPEMPYLRPPWIQRHLEPLLMTRLPGQPVLRVRGRASGRIRVVPVRPVEVGALRYLVALVGDTHWARNLRASGTAELVEHGSARQFRAVEVAGDERVAAEGLRSRCGWARRAVVPRRVQAARFGLYLPDWARPSS
jgi:hypothetical protein